MADNNIGNLISNYGDMSIEELGGSLLQRQSDIAAEQAKEDKKKKDSKKRSVDEEKVKIWATPLGILGLLLLL